MAENAVTRRYAGALLDLGAEVGALDALADQLESVSTLLQSGDGDLFKALCHPGFAPEERRGVLQAVLARVEVNPLVANFLRVVLDKGRFSMLPDITENFRTMVDARGGRVRALVTTAHPIDADLAASIRASLEDSTGKQVVLDTAVDASLIGGLIVAVGDRVYDASIRSRIDSLRRQLLTQAAVGEA